MIRFSIPALLALFVVFAPGFARAQVSVDTLYLGIDAAISRAADESEEVRLARSRVDLAEAQVSAAWAQILPQINGSVGYTRTLASPFDTGGGFTLPDSLRFEPDPSLPIEERVDYLENRVPVAALGTMGTLFGDLPFGQENLYAFSLSGSQLLYAGGRTGAAIQIARSVEDATRLNLREELADVELSVRTAYYQAQFAQELITISQAAIERAERFLSEERLRLEAGEASDLDVLRAEVELENLRPQLVEATNTAELAMLNLKRLLNIPVEQPVGLSTPLEPPAPGEVVQPPDAAATVARRASLQAANEQVAIRERQVQIARGAFLPSISLTTTYGKQIYPSTLTAFNEDWRTDWNVGIQISVPIFDGFRRSAEVQQARVELRQAELQREQLAEGIRMDYERAVGERQRALAQVEASRRTVDQAERVYELTELQYDEGQTTQLQVFSAQLALLQARTNYARALSDYYVADAGAKRAMGVVSPAIVSAGG